MGKMWTNKMRVLEMPSARAAPAFYELRLRRVDGTWRVAGETVLPWPDPATVKSFLPPREH